MRAGFSDVDITPELGLPMMGMPGSPRATEGVKWPLHGRIAVFDDGDSRAAIIGLDLGAVSVPVVAELREVVTRGMGLAPTDVMIACTHTHSGPCCTAVMDEDTDFGYVGFIGERLAQAMREAVDSLQPVSLRVGHVEAPGWCFNRRSIFRVETGAMDVGTFGPRGGDAFVGTEGPEDNEIIALLAEDEHGQPVGGVVNFSCHPTLMGGIPVYSADFVGSLTEALKDHYGCVFVYLTGAAGNLSPYSLVPGEEMVKGEQYATEMGEALARKAGEALTQGAYVVGEPLQSARRVISIAQRRPTREQIRLARWYLEEAPTEVDQKEFTRRMYGHDYTFYGNRAEIQEWMARETIGMWEWQRRVGTRDPREDVEVQAIAVGKIAFVGFPAEYFTEFGLETKAKSPFVKTFVAELANGYHGYVATREAFEHGGYEPRLGYQSRLVPEAGSLMCETAVSLLSKLGS